MMNLEEDKEFQERRKKYSIEREKTHGYDEYKKNMMLIAKNLLGTKEVGNMKRRKIKSFEFDGIDITTSTILATFPNIKERFNEDWTYYFNDGRSNPLEMLLQAAFHYGWDAGEKYYKKNNDFRSLYCDLIKELNKKKDER